MNFRKIGYGLLAFVLATSISYFGKQIPGAINQLSAAPLTRATLEQQIHEADTAGIYALIAEHFPNEYAAFTNQVLQRANNGEYADEDGFLRSFEDAKAFTAELRRSNGHFLQTAPDDVLHALILSQTAILTRLAAENPELCARFANSGAMTFSPEELMAAGPDDIGQIGNLTFKAIIAGRDRPVLARTMTDEEWNEVFVRYIDEAPTNQSYFDVLFSNQHNHPQYCEASLSFQLFFTQASDPLIVKAGAILTISAAGI